jgi:16S rRNA (cytosine1402-N4)-methyltransferase
MTSAHQLALPGLAEAAIEWVWSESAEEETHVESFAHATVMKEETIAALAPRPRGLYVDATLGGGGHAEAICDAAEGCRVVAIDKDARALAAAHERLARFGDRVVLLRGSFAEIRRLLAERGIAKVDGLCADLGVSSPQLDEPSRGMSFRHEGPIDMRMDQDDGETALELIERLDDEALADVIFRYGDERRSRRIARSIKRALYDGELITTLDLRRAIVRAVGPVRVGGVDPATRTFQALRIAVNEEMAELQGLLSALPEVITPGGVAAILSFHSLEDRAVKHAFLDKGVWQPLFKKPLLARDEERSQNPRSRSAKLRAARRLAIGPS